MLPDDDDGLEAGGGPPPDPSLRAWRHPSEIAAAAAAASRPGPDAVRDTRPLVTLGGAALSLLVIAGLALYVNDRSATGPEVSAVVAGGGGRPAPPIRPVSTTTAAGSEATEDRLAAAGDDDATGRPAETAGPDETPTATTTGQSSTAASAATTSPVGPPAEPDFTVDRSPGSPGPGPPDGVFALGPEDLVRLGGYVALEGLVFTSASAVGGRQRVAVLARGEWAEAEVLGIDEPTDIAVLRVDPESADRFFAAAPPVIVDGDETTAPGPGTGVRVPPAEPGGAMVSGTVIALDQITVTRAGSSIYGSLTTTAKRPPSAGGSGLYEDERNAVLGVIIESAGTLTAAVPIDRVLDIGRNLTAHGVPAVEWLGIRGVTPASGGVHLTGVDEGGPADGAGLESGDRILVADGTAVEGLDHLVYLIRKAGAGATISLEIERLGSRRTIEAVVGKRETLSTPTG